MILSKQYLKGLVSKGKAVEQGIVTNVGRYASTNYMAVLRYDLQRIDHYII